MSTALGLLCAVAAGCPEATSTEPAADPGPDTTAPLPSALFPLAAGDRWRTRSDPAGVEQVFGVTAVSTDGTSVIFGTGHTAAERYRADDEGVYLVSPEGTVLLPLLRAPIRTGAAWSYQLEDRGVSVPCRAQVHEVGTEHRVAGVSVEGCVELTRICRYGAGSPFLSATTHHSEETYCPGIGRVQQRDRFDPPPPMKALPAERTETVVWYRVAGAPAKPDPERFDCSEFLLMPSDVQAACGAQVEPREPVAGSDGALSCTYVYGVAQARLEVTAERRTHDVSDVELDLLLADGEPPTGIVVRDLVRIRTTDEVRMATREGHFAILVRTSPAACAEDSALRMAPLLRSLLR